MAKYSITKSRLQAKTLLSRRIAGMNGKQSLLMKAMDIIEEDMNAKDQDLRNEAVKSLIKLLPYALEKCGRESENKLATAIGANKGSITLTFNSYLDDRRTSMDIQDNTVVSDEILIETPKQPEQANNPALTAKP